MSKSLSPRGVLWHIDQVGPDPRPSGPRGQPAGLTPWPANQALRWFGLGLDGHITTLVQKEYPRLEVGGGHEKSSAGHVARPPARHLVSYHLSQVSGAPPRPSKYPPTVEMRRHHIMEIPLAKLGAVLLGEWRGSEGQRASWPGDGSGTRWRDRDALMRCCVPPATHRPASSTTSSVTMASNLMLKSCKDLSLGE
jgi:hypothetical protein